MAKLTKSYVDRLESKGKRYSVRCSVLRGFEIRCNANGTKTASAFYFLRGRQHRVTLGVIGEAFTVAQARSAAAAVLIEAKRGRDTAGERAKVRKAPTLAQASAAYMARARTRCKPSTLESYSAILRRNLLPALGDVKVSEITQADVEALQVAASSPMVANLVLSVLSAILAYAVKQGHCEANPCRDVDRVPTKPRSRVLKPEERVKLEAALAQAEGARRNQDGFLWEGFVSTIRLLLLTACRSGEITGLTWDQVDLDSGALHLVDSKVGPRSVPLSDQAVEYLGRLRSRASSSPFVCPGQTGNRQTTGLWRAWNILRARCGLEDVRIHDLRRSAATSAIAAGVPISMVSGILGHSSTRMTEAYVHTRFESYRDAARAMGESIEKQTKTQAKTEK